MAASKKIITVTFDNRTNRVFFIKSNVTNPPVHTGQLARDAIFALINAGYTQDSADRGDTYSVIGYSK